MGRALLAGLARAGAPGRVEVIEPRPSIEVVALCDAQGFVLCGAPPAGEPPAGTLLLAIKPQMLDSVAPTLSALVGSETLVVSILAGKRISDLSARLARKPSCAPCPTRPPRSDAGSPALSPTPQTSEPQRKLAQRLLAAAGEVVWVEREELIDAVTAVSGSGPAYVFLLAECLAAAGAAAGLPEDLAARLARATVSGAGELMHRTPELSPRDIARKRHLARRHDRRRARRADGARRARAADDPRGRSRQTPRGGAVGVSASLKSSAIYKARATPSPTGGRRWPSRQRGSDEGSRQSPCQTNRAH